MVKYSDIVKSQEVHHFGCTSGVCAQNNPDRVQITTAVDLKIKDLSFRDLIVEYYHKRRELLNLGYKITQLREINNI